MRTRGSNCGRSHSVYSRAGSLRHAVAIVAVIGCTIAAFAAAAPAALASSPPAPSVTLTSHAAGATGVDYRVDFYAPALSSGDSVTVTAPAGTSFANSTADVIDLQQGVNLAAGTTPTLSDNDQTITIPVNSSTPADEELEIWLKNVSNPTTAASGESLQVSTSESTTPVNSTSYSIVAAQSISTPSAGLTATTAGATGVDYHTTFKLPSSGGLTGTSDSITVTAPSGTSFANSTTASYYPQVLDESQNWVNVAAFEVAPTLSNNDQTITIPVAPVAKAGDVLQVRLLNVQNPGGGVIADSPASVVSDDTLQVSTTSSPTPVNSASYTIIAAHPLATPSLSLTATAAGATGVDYVATFPLPAAAGLSGTGDSITVTAPSGTTFASSFYPEVLDETQNWADVALSAPTLSNSGQTITIPVTGAKGGDRLQVRLPSVTNPAVAASGETLQVSTTSSPTPANTTSYSIVAAPSVLTPSVSLTTNAAGVSGADYRATFKLPSSGGLTGTGDSITIALPSGTSLANEATESYLYEAGVEDETRNTVVGTGSNATFSNDDQTITIPVSGARGGDLIEVTLPNVENPVSPASGETLQISTTSSPTAVNTNSYSIVAAQAISAPSVSLTTTDAGATAVDYRATFTLPSSGGLTGTGDSITVTAPTGTSFANSSEYWYDGYVQVLDLSRGGSELSGCCSFPVSNNNQTITIPVSGAKGGDEIEVLLGDASNPTSAASGENLQISTTSSPTTVNSRSYSIGAAQAISAPSVSLTATAAGATDVDYRATFTLPSEGGLTGMASAITITAPTGTAFSYSTADEVEVMDETHNDQSVSQGNEGTLSNNDQTITIPVDQADAGDELEVWLPYVSNPASAASGEVLQVSTTSSPAQVNSNAYSIVAAPSVSTPSVSLTSTEAGATGVDYHASFTLPSAGGLNGAGDSLTVTAPSGTSFTNVSSDPIEYLAVLDETQGGTNVWTDGFPTLSNNGQTMTIPVSGANGGDQLELVLRDVSNPTSAATGETLQVSTTSSPTPASSDTYTIANPQSVSPPAVSVSSTTPSATDVTYNVTFTTSSTGGLTGTNDSITIAAPAGTVFPTYGYSVFDESQDDTNVANYCCATLSNSGATITIPLSSGVSAGDTLIAQIEYVTNPSSSGPWTLTASTTSDTVPSTSGDYSAGSVASSSSPLSKVSPKQKAPAVTTTSGASSTKSTVVKGHHPQERCKLVRRKGSHRQVLVCKPVSNGKRRHLARAAARRRTAR